MRARHGAVAIAISAVLMSGCDGWLLGEDAPPEMTISKALEVESAGTVAITGFLLLQNGDSIVLCDHQLDSYPPQCGTAGLKVHGVDVRSLPGSETAGEVSWANHVALTGELEDGTLIVDSYELRPRSRSPSKSTPP